MWRVVLVRGKKRVQGNNGLSGMWKVTGKGREGE